MSNIIEVDGPACAMFEYARNGAQERITYRLFVWRGDNPRDVLTEMDAVRRSILQHAVANNDMSIIYWRRRPSLQYIDPVELQVVGSDNSVDVTAGVWQSSFRLAVEPDLPPEAWAMIESRVTLEVL